MHAASTWWYAVVDVGVLGRDRVEGPLPEVAGEREHVGLVHEREVLARARPREVERVADAPLDAHARVHRALRRDLVRRALAQEPALARVDALGVLADHDEVDVGVAGVGRRGERYRQTILSNDAALNDELLRMTDAYTDELFPITPAEGGRVVFPLS